VHPEELPAETLLRFGMNETALRCFEVVEVKAEPSMLGVEIHTEIEETWGSETADGLAMISAAWGEEFRDEVWEEGARISMRLLSYRMSWNDTWVRSIEY
jgi:hypothetical protein